MLASVGFVVDGQVCYAITNDEISKVGSNGASSKDDLLLEALTIGITYHIALHVATYFRLFCAFQFRIAHLILVCIALDLAIYLIIELIDRSPRA